jgi:Methyltransferase domain
VKHSSRSRLHPGQAFRFPEETLHDRVARALCEARCLPRKEFYESWSFVGRVRRHLDAPVLWDLCAGHGLVGFLFALLEPDLVRVRCVDRKRPLSFERLRTVLAPISPERIEKVTYEERSLERLDAPTEPTYLVAVHACGRRTDLALDLALAARASVAVLPCCHDASYSIERGDLPPALLARLEKHVAVDAARIMKLARAGYQVLSRKIDDESTACAEAILGKAPRAREFLR